MSRIPRSQKTRERGGVLIVAIVTAVLAVGLSYSAVLLASADRKDAARDLQTMQARALADAGIQRAVAFVKETLALDPFTPLQAIDGLIFTDGNPAAPKTCVVATDEALQKNGRTYGSFTVTLEGNVASNDARDVTITATGYVPNAAAPVAKASLQATVRVGLQPGQVFDYSYFINNWGWFYGDTINAYGNVRSNGQFDSAGYAPGVFGTPRYSDLDLTDPAHPKLVGYLDDNGDGVTDGTDGGIFAGWDVVHCDHVRGMGGQAENEHDFVDPVPMPNLSDLSHYEQVAKDASASISIGGASPSTICNAVLGDEPGEKKNLILVGTAAAPIVLNGPVVVRGDVIIKGVVTGQGTIYAGGNVYIPDNLTYANPPATWLPANESQAATEAWLAANQSKDFCGLFAREHVVMGNFNDWIWQYYVAWWLGSSMNSSVEDAGVDGIPNTHLGRDGIPGTEDDDVLEGDGLWTVDHYTQAQADLGLLPPGKNVGDPIPGTGEDIDGDGVFDPTTSLAEFNLPAALDSGEWAGNLPAGIHDYSAIASTTMTNIDAVVYTNHTAALTTLAWGQPFDWHGAIVSRNESLIYGTNSMNLYYDRRLTGGGTVRSELPKTLAPLQFIAWQRLDADTKIKAGANP